MKALQLSPPDPDIGGAVSFSANRINVNVSASMTSAAAVTKIFDRNGEPVLKPSSRKMRAKLFDVAFSHNKLIQSKVFNVASNRRVYRHQEMKMF